mgnify:CR=1 FL=1
MNTELNGIFTRHAEWLESEGESGNQLALDKINPNGSSISIQRQVASLQTKLRKLQESGLPIYEKDGATIEMWQRYLGKFE